MHIRYLPSTVGATGPSMYLTTYLVNDTLAVDAGCLGFWGEPAQQSQVTDVVLTHSHLDHIASLPMFLNNVYRPDKSPVRLYASEAAQTAIKTNIFNESLWADWNWLVVTDPPFVEPHLLEANKSIDVGGIGILPVPVNHPAGCLGLILRDADCSVAISSDTGPTEEFWRACNKTSHLSALFVEVSFPNALESLALSAGHLTPKLLAAELCKLERPVRTIAMHLKANSLDQIVSEINELGLDQVEVVQPGLEYQFGAQ